jgi:hypothetical protein
VEAAAREVDGSGAGEVSGCLIRRREPPETEQEGRGWDELEAPRRGRGKRGGRRHGVGEGGEDKVGRVWADVPLSGLLRCWVFLSLKRHPAGPFFSGPRSQKVTSPSPSVK